MRENNIGRIGCAVIMCLASFTFSLSAAALTKVQLAEEAVKARDYRKARILFHQLIRERPGNAHHYTQLAKLEQLTGKRDKAFKIASQALTIDPAQQDAMLVVAQIALSRGDTESALEHFQRLVDLYPEDQRAYQGLSTVYSQRGQDDQSAAARKAAANIISGNESLGLQ
jgi:tetratricopeptide (TPR) repeat protein